MNKITDVEIYPGTIIFYRGNIRQEIKYDPLSVEITMQLIRLSRLLNELGFVFYSTPLVDYWVNMERITEL